MAGTSTQVAAVDLGEGAWREFVTVEGHEYVNGRAQPNRIYSGYLVAFDKPIGDGSVRLRLYLSDMEALDVWADKEALVAYTP